MLTSPRVTDVAPSAKPRGQEGELTGPLAYIAAINESDLDKGVKAMLHAMVQWVDFRTGLLYPGVARIAAAMSIKPRAVRRIRRRAEAAGVLVLVKPSVGGVSRDTGRGIPNQMRFDLDALRRRNADRRSPLNRDRKALEPGPKGAETRTDVHENGDRRSAEQTSEQINEQTTSTTRGGGGLDTSAPEETEGNERHDLEADLLKFGVRTAPNRRTIAGEDPWLVRVAMTACPKSGFAGRPSEEEVGRFVRLFQDGTAHELYREEVELLQARAAAYVALRAAILELLISAP